MLEEAALAQLMEMGIPRGRARAALIKSKWDVMSAAVLELRSQERVFAGEVDDIASDDDGGFQDTVEGTSTTTAIDVDAGTEEDSQADDDHYEAFGMDTLVDDDIAPGADPYASVFFSKDRVESVIEIVEPQRYKHGPHGEQTNIPVLSRGAWMSGCPEAGEQSFLFQLYNDLEEAVVPCAGCREVSFIRSRDDYFAVHPEFDAYIEELAAVIHQTCGRCGFITCMACEEKFESTRVGRKTGKSTAANADATVVGDTEKDQLLHCPKLQGIILGVGLHMLERTFASGQEGSTDHTTDSHSSRKRKKKVAGRHSSVSAAQQKPTPPSMPKSGAKHGMQDLTSEDDEVQFFQVKGGKARNNGTGYGGASSEDRTGQIAAQKAQNDLDAKVTRHLNQLRIYLPSYGRESGARTSDHLVHPTALAHIRRRSGFLNDLLRNDSLLGMSNRAGLYEALLDWLYAVSKHESLASMLAMPSMRPIRTTPIDGTRDGEQQLEILYEGSPSPRELLESCVIQAQAALKGLSATAYRDENTPDDIERSEQADQATQQAVSQAQSNANADLEKLQAFCERIIQSAESIDTALTDTKGKAFVERMKAELPKLPSSIPVFGENKESVMDAVKLYEDWAGRVRFSYCDLSEPSHASSGKPGYRHHFNSELQAIDNVDAPKRSLAIAKELAMLTTNLPVSWHSSIFLRVDETRVDCLKAMIIGPEGTPYENGCFLFDVFLYNQSCPQVHYLTTNGGQYRYNPNLYANGKVCLSLLGTWSGPGWIAGQSTLLQVLISIQSLILCEEPFVNEPGWAGHEGSPASKAYSANVRRMVVKDAMTNNLKNPPFGFENEVKTHFRLKAPSIREQLDKWKKADDGRSISRDGASASPAETQASQSQPAEDDSTKRTPFDKAADDLRVLLDDLTVPPSLAADSAEEGQA